MSESWQQIAVWSIVVIAAAVAIWSGISAWRSIRKGECGHCAGCNGELPPVEEKKKERLVFLPRENLGSASKRRGG